MISTKKLIVLGVAMSMLLVVPGLNVNASNTPGEADGLVVVAKARSATVANGEVFANAIGGNYIVDIETFTDTGAPYEFTQWGLVLASIDPENGGNVAPGTCVGLAGDQDDLCIYADGGTTSATNEMTVRIPASAIAYGAALPANGVALTFILHKDAEGDSLDDGTGFLPAGNLNIVANQLAASGDYAGADDADEGFTPLFLLDAQPAGFVQSGNALFNPGFEVGGPEGDTGDLPNGCDCQVRSAAPPWFLYSDVADASGSNLPHSSSELLVGGGTSGNAFRVDYDEADNNRVTFVGQHLPKPQQPAARWIGSDSVSAEFDIRVVDRNGVLSSFHAASTLHWNDGSADQLTKWPAGGVATDGAWHHISLDFGDAAEGANITFFSLSLNGAGHPAGTDLVIDYDNVQLRGALLDNSDVRSDAADGYAVHITPYQSDLADASGKAAQRLVSFADGSLGYLYEVTVYDFTDIVPRVVDINSEIAGGTFRLLDEDYILDGGSPDPAKAAFSTALDGDAVYSFTGPEGGLSPSILVATGGDLGVDGVASWFWGDIGTDAEFESVFGHIDPVSGYGSVLKDAVRGLSVADQLDYAFTPLALSDLVGASLGDATAVTAGCVGGSTCWAGAGQPISVLVDLTSASSVFETSTVDIVAAADGTVLATADVDLPADSVTVTVSGATMDALYASGDMKVLARVNPGKFAAGATSGIIDVDNVLPTADFTVSPGGAVTSLTTLTFTDDSSDSDGAIALRDWRVDFLDDPTPDGDADTPGLVAAGSGSSLSFSPADDGVYAVNLTVFDDDGGQAWKNETFTVDNIGPIASFDVADFVQPGAVTFTDLSADPDGAISQANWVIDGTTLVDPGATFTQTFNTDGVYAASLSVTDNDGDVSPTVSKVFTVDGSAPVTNVSLPEAGSDGWYNGPVTVSFDASDVGPAGVATTTAVIDGAVVGSSVDGDVVTVTVSTQGETTVEYQAVDNAGNSEVESGTVLKSVDVKIDSVAPELTMTNPSTLGALGPLNLGGVFLAGTNITVDIDAFEATSGLSEVFLKIDGVTVGTDDDGSDGWSFEVDTSGWATGHYDLLAFAFDAAGNLGTTQVVTVTVVNTDANQNLCHLEDPSAPYDGECGDGQYSLSDRTTMTDYVMCGIVDDVPMYGGKCDENGHYTAPDENEIIDHLLP